MLYDQDSAFVAATEGVWVFASAGEGATPPASGGGDWENVGRHARRRRRRTLIFE